MPAHRRRPTPQPSRRPQVAGLRRPGERPAPKPRPRPYSAQQEDLEQDEDLLADGTQAPVAPEPEAPVEPETPEAAETPAEAPVTEEPEELAPEEVASVPARPAPRPKARDTGTPMPTTERDLEPEPAEAEAKPPAPKAKSGRRDETPFWIAVALAVLFAIAGGLLAWQYFAASAVSENKAQVDPLASDQIQADVKEAIKTLFSYDYAKLDGRAGEVDAVLASGKLKDQFAALNCAVQDQAPKQKIVTSTQVSYSAVTEQTDDTAKLIVFVENAWERQSTKQQGTGAGSLGVTAKLVGDEWKIQELNIYGGETGKEPKVPEKCR